MAGIELSGLRKVFDDGTEAVRGIDLDVPDGTLVVLVGPSGCGKTTILRLIAGLEQPTEGAVRIGGRVVNEDDPKDRDVAMVFQNHALYPHMNVYDNMAFGLKLRGADRREIDRRVRLAAETMGLTDVLRRKPRHLSGGQRQRVAMGRAIVREPQAFLMDEPLSNLDATLRVQMRGEIARTQKQLGVTTVYVTHDQVEAMTMGDRVAVMREGRVLQVDTPQALYARPRDLFVARFIGAPAMNLARTPLERRDGGVFVRLGDDALRVDPEALERHRSLDRFLGREVVVGIRPEDLEDAEFAADAPPDRRLTPMVDLHEAMGPEVHVHFRVRAGSVGGLPGQAEAEAANGGGVPFVARLNPRSTARAGVPVELAVDTRSLHFFDPQTGEAVG